MEDEALYFSVNSPEHWSRRGVTENLDIGDTVRLRSDARYGVLDTASFGELEGVGTVSAFAVGLFGRLILLDDAGDLWTYDRHSRHHERLFVARHGLFSAAAMLASTGDTLLVADPDGERMLAAYDVNSGQTRWSRTGEWIDGVYCRPLALYADSRGIYVLTLAEEPSEAEAASVALSGKAPLRILRLSLSGGLIAAIEDERFALKLPPDGGKHGQPFLTVSPLGDMYVYDSLGRTLFAFSAAGELLTRMMLPPLSFAGLAVDSSRQIYVGDSRSMDSEGEDDRFILQFEESGELIGKVGGFRGKADAILIDGRDRMYILNGEQQTLAVLDLQPQTLAMPGGGALEGFWLSSAFDSADRETVWHKFTLAADIPDGTQLRVRYFADDTGVRTIGGNIWRIDDWIARNDLSPLDKLRGLREFWSEAVVNPGDALFFGAKGRYLWMLVEWIGSERSTPALSRLRVYFPRQTLLSYLPAVYQQETGGRGFLERYLALFGTLFDEMEERIDGMARQFDRETVGGGQLRWLASWLGLDTNEYWSDDAIRRLIRAAPDMYRYRGTRRGIEQAIETLTGMKPIIVEPAQYKALRERGDWRAVVDRLYGNDPFTFSVLLHPDQARSDMEKVLLRQLVDDIKPAHTEAKLEWLQPWMYLDLHTYLGVNTVLAEPSIFTLGDDRSMPNDTLIVDANMNRRLDAHMRLGLDSEME
ncbi:phage tail protein [Cohnella sp. GCM10020058]|uniref:phage tail protein n=1 Tax=Cohnella sp. GCM10020058 TaxID=3317330 RepID=UPI00362B7313